MKEQLDSDRVNYLIWRYLLEGNYRETAAKFQKEWRVPQPHRQFDFAPHVKNYALVDVLNKGLVYQGLERDYAQSQVPGDAAATATPGDVPRGVFGPLVAQQPIDYNQLQDEEEDEDPLPPPPPPTKAAAAAAATTGPNGVEVEKSQPPPPPPPPSSSHQQQQQAPSLPPQSQNAQPQLQQSQSQTQPSQTQAQSTNAQSNAPSQPNNAPAVASLKRQVDAQQGQLPNGTPAKRPRLGNATNGAVLENGVVDTATSPMDVDQHQSDNHAYPSPLEGEQAPTPAPRTEGPDHATQIDKVEELGPKTIYLRLTPDESLLSSAGSVAAEASRAHSHSPILLQCEWNPKDPTRLAAAGTDALARVWTVSQATTGPEQPSQPQTADHVTDREDPNCPNINLVNTDDIPPNSKVTAFSWAYDGQRIAVATEDEQTARIGLCNLQGGEEHHWEGFETPIVKLRCNPVNRTILSVSPAMTKNASNQPDGWIVSVMSSLTGTGPVEHRLTGHDVFLDEPDVAWMNGTDFLLCVGTKLLQFRYAGDAITQVRDFATRPDDPLTAVQYDGSQEAGYIAAATSSGHIDIWDASGERLPSSNDAPAHDGRISVLQWQPRQDARDGERLLASGGEDGIIAIRDARYPDQKPKFEMTIDDDNPVLALSFTPDGAFVAGATRDKVLIWKVGEYVMPRASWTRTSHAGRLSPKVVDGTAEVEDQHCLCWDADGHRLAFGVNDLLAVISFR